MLTAATPSFGWLIAGRVFASASQATLFAIAMVTAIELMGSERSGQAVAIIASGLTTATVLGVPLGALIGNSGGWRLPFVLIAALALVGVTLLAISMPRTPRLAASVGDEVRTLLNPRVLLAVATTVAGFAGVGIVFVYLVVLAGSCSRVDV